MPNRPYGGLLINRVSKPVSDSKGLKKINIGFDDFLDLRNIAEGVFSPLKGFLTSTDFDSVIKNYRLSSGLTWTIPIVFDITKQQAQAFKEGDDVFLVYNDKPVGLLHLEDKFSPDKKAWCDAVYATHDKNHPGVLNVFKRGEVLLGGRIDYFNNVVSDRFRLSPAETRELFRQNGWRTVAAFQTRNAPHRAHEYLQKTALEVVDGLLVHPLIGRKKTGDYRNDVIVGAYDLLVSNYYPNNSVVFSILTTMMQYAGPMEAVHHAIMRRNHGCTHFIIGRDHAGVNGFYPPFAAQEVFNKFPDLGIQPLFFENAFYCGKCRSISTVKTCPHTNDNHLIFSGTYIRKMLKDKSTVPSEMMRPEIYKYLIEQKDLYVE